MEDRFVMVKNVENIAPNQLVIRLTNGLVIFNSYGKNIVVFDNKENSIKLDEKYWDYSWTTAKYRNKFLNEKKRDTERHIKDGEYELTDLN